MQQLNSLGLHNQIILNAKLYIHDKVMGATSMKESFFTHRDNIETTPPKLDNTKRISMILDSISDICQNIKLSHDSHQFYVLPNNSIMEFLKGVNS